ncbi:MAG: LamG-like jellyroll fold domain-containing protein [Verrucomicrobiota bacterium]
MRVGSGSLLGLINLIGLVVCSVSFAQLPDLDQPDALSTNTLLGDSVLTEIASTNAPPGPPPAPVSSVTQWTEAPESCSEFSRKIEQVRYTTYSDGSVQSEIISPGYTELGSGLNYRDDAGQWQPSAIKPEVAADGVVTFSNLPVQYRFAANANLETVVETSGDGTKLANCAVAGLSYYEETTGKSFVFAQVKDSKAQPFDEGVFYPSAFDGADADIVYRVHPWGLEQDIVLFGGLPSPSVYGLDDNESVLCILTELVDFDLSGADTEREGDIKADDPSPAPLQVFSQEPGTRRRIHNWQRCQAYAEDEASLTLGGSGAGQPVAMRVLSVEGRTYLSEEVLAGALMKEASYLFAEGKNGREEAQRIARKRSPRNTRTTRNGREERPLPFAPRLAKAPGEGGSIRVNSRSVYVPRSPQRYVVDYVDYSGTNTLQVTFRTANTYFIKNPLVFDGPNAILTIEPGCFVKLTNSASIKFQNGARIETKSHALSPALFTTAGDTNGAGETIYSANPVSNKYWAALIFESPTNNTVKGLRIRYAQTGIRFSSSAGGQRVQDAQLSFCDRAIEVNQGSETATVFNCLIRDTPEGIRAEANAVLVQACTFDRMTNWALCATGSVSQLAVRDTVFASVTNTFSSNCEVRALFDFNGTYNCTAGWAGTNTLVLTNSPFAVGSQGSNYLLQTSGAVNAGSANADALGLYHFTTATNHVKESNSVVDISFHYPSTNDSDGDGLWDFLEDTDGNGLYTNLTDLSNWQTNDTDGDTLWDGDEVNTYGTNPKTNDTDGDGYSDALEVSNGSNPLLTNSFLTSISGTISNLSTLTGTIYIKAEALPPTNGLVMYYSFADNEGTNVTDLSGHTNSGTVMWGATYVTNGPGGWYQFDGTNDHIRVSRNPTTNSSYTVALWFNSGDPKNFSNTRNLFSFDRRYLIGTYYVSNTYVFYSYALSAGGPSDPGVQQQSSGFSLEHGTWHHVALVVDGVQTSGTFYLDGGFLGSGTGGGSVNTGWKQVIMGALHNWSTNSFWIGRLDEGMVYDRALSLTDVTNLYELGVNFYIVGVTNLPSPGSYTLTNLSTLKRYTIFAWADANTNGVRERWEPCGVYTGSPLYLTAQASGIDILLVDPDADGDGFTDYSELAAGTDPDDSNSYPVAISGDVGYGGRQTGTVWVTANIQPPTNSLAVHYDFNIDEPTNIVDMSGNGYTGRLFGATYTNTGVLGGAYYFSNDYIRVGTGDVLDVVVGGITCLTACTWVKLEKLNIESLFIGKYQTPYPYTGWALWQQSQNLAGTELMATWPNRAQALSTTLMTTGVWYFLCGTFEVGTNFMRSRIYVNGVLEGTAETNGSHATTDTSAELWLGKRAPGGIWPFYGRQDETRIFTRLLGAQEIASLYQHGLSRHYQAQTASPGAYVISNVPNLRLYNVDAYRDSNGNQSNDATEAQGTYTNNPVYLVNSTSNINITLTDLDSDQDGMPDWWEIQYGLNPSSGVSAARVGWWKFDETSGTNADNAASSSYDGQLVNMATNVWVTGKLGNALELDGTNDYVRVPQNPPMITGQQFTASGWAYLKSGFPTYYPTLIADMYVCGGYNYPGFWLGYDKDVPGPAGLLGTCGGYAYPYATVTMTNVWRYLALTYDGTNARLYVDGAQVAVQSGSFVAATQAEVRIGWGNDPSFDYHWQGKLDDVRLYSTALSSNAVYTMYDALQDKDGDGLLNLQEFQYGANPTNTDTDGDERSDGQEVLDGTDPAVWESPLPYSTGFETNEGFWGGGLDGQGHWTCSSANVVVESNTVHEGAQAVCLSGWGSSAQHGLYGTNAVVTNTIYLYLTDASVFPPATSSIPTNASGVISYDPDQGIMAYDGSGGGSWKAVTNSLLPNRWVQLQVILNYTGKTWAVSVDGGPPLTGLGFRYSGCGSLHGVRLSSGSAGEVCVDDVSIKGQ